MSNMIFFGAGASFGSDAQGTPPLGSALFNALADIHPKTWGEISASEADAFRRDFEIGMDKYVEAHPRDGTVDRLQRAMASYFFEFQPRDSSLYLRLAKRIRACEWNGALVSLNYERLLDLALLSCGLVSHIQGVRKGNTDIDLILPHGCCHLFGKIRAPVPTPNIGCPGVPITGAGTQPRVRVVPQVPTILKTGKRTDGTEPTTNLVGPGLSEVDFGHGIRFDSDMVRIIEDPEEHARELRENGVPPAMSYFQPNKDTRSGKSFINAQRERFAELVGQASTVAIIGVKVRPDDKHIWDPLRTTGARIVYCCKEGMKDDDKFRSWSAEEGRKSDMVLPTCWKHDFDALCSAVGIMPSM